MCFLPILAIFFTLFSCGESKEHTAPAIYEKDSVSLMVSYGVNMLISDSGVIKYRVVAERWDVNTVRTPSRWTFEKGLFMEKFDEGFNTQAYIQADSAWYYDQKKLWELRGRVKIRNLNGMAFYGEELFWDGVKREIYSYQHSLVKTPDRTLEGTYFRSDENMNRYVVSNSGGSFVKSDVLGDNKTDTVPLKKTSAVKPAEEVKPIKPVQTSNKNAPNRIRLEKPLNSNGDMKKLQRVSKFSKHQ